jgi:hypothetical protein
MRKSMSRRPSPAAVIAFVALMIALSGSAIALPGTNKVDSGDIKNGTVKSKDVRDNNLKSRDVRDGALTGVDIKDGTLAGADIDEGTLGQVPSAATAARATTADNAAAANRATTAGKADTAAAATTAGRADTAGAVDGRIPFRLLLAAGESETIAQNGAISLVAECNSEADDEQVRILAATTADGAIAQGYEDDHTGPGDVSDYLDVATDAADRELVELTDTAGDVSFEDDIDSSYVVSPAGDVLSLGSETTVLGLNYAGATCFVAGVVDSIG